MYKLQFIKFGGTQSVTKGGYLLYKSSKQFFCFVLIIKKITINDLVDHLHRETGGGFRMRSEGVGGERRKAGEGGRVTDHSHRSRSIPFFNQ